MRFFKFLRDESGALAPVFTIGLVPMIALVGASIDLSNMTRTKNMLQAAVDSTALAINHNLHSATQQGLQTKAQNFFTVQTQEIENPVLDPVSFNIAQGRVDVSATATYTPHIMQNFGFGPLEIGASATTVVGDQELEVAMVLDNSGSMAGDKIDALEDASESLVGTLFASQNANTRIKVGIVPFAGAVNVGADYKDAVWMDTAAKSPIHSENFVTTANRFTLFDQLDVDWKGCVEVRPGDYGTNDTEPTQDIGATLFVPLFAPDESSDYNNNYIKDSGGCTNEEKGNNDSKAVKQARICKYREPEWTDEYEDGDAAGPNATCTTKSILPLTNNTIDLYAKIDAMRANGSTNIHEGVMWGWRILSPAKPFQEGKAYNTPNLRKYIILMTDGENFATGRENFNMSEYSAYGYASKGRYGEVTDDTSDLEDLMDDKVELACENAKKAGITIYTIGFMLPQNATATKNMLSKCASDPTLAYLPKNTSELEPVFQSIALELGKLRLTQ